MDRFGGPRTARAAICHRGAFRDVGGVGRVPRRRYESDLAPAGSGRRGRALRRAAAALFSPDRVGEPPSTLARRMSRSCQTTSAPLPPFTEVGLSMLWRMLRQTDGRVASRKRRRPIIPLPPRGLATAHWPECRQIAGERIVRVDPGSSWPCYAGSADRRGSGSEIYEVALSRAVV